MRLFLVLLLALLVGGLGACDFTPTLDVPIPDFEPALVINGVLEADSTVEVRVTIAADPYVSLPDEDFRLPDGVEVSLERDGAVVGPLRLDSESCEDYSSPIPPTGPTVYECGSYVSDVVIEAGRTYTVRATAPGFPEAHATVTVPDHVAVSVTGGPTTESQHGTDGKRFRTDLVVTLEDPPGLGQHYGLGVLTRPYYVRSGGQRCNDEGCVFVPSDPPDSTYIARPGTGYTTTDPVLLASARTVPATGISFIAFDDESFDGRTRSFSVRAQQFWYPSQSTDEPRPPIGVQIISSDALTFQAYQIAWFSGGEDNPFSEPVNLPSNVVGGYGLLGAATITEALLIP